MTKPSGEGRVPMLIVDDQESFREMLRHLVAVTPGFVLVGEAASGEDALVAVGDLSPQLVLMDVRMPGMGGIDAARRVTSAHPEVMVILVSVEPLDSMSEDLDHCGAAAFARKQDLSPRLIRELWSQRSQRLGVTELSA